MTIDHDFKRIGVLGAGQMGAGIAQICAALEIKLTLVDINVGQIDKAKINIATSLEKLESKALIPPGHAKKTLQHLHFSTSITSFQDQDLVIEAINENESLKTSVLKQIDEILPPHAILASNTSSISITRLASATSRSDRFIGMHFMNPVPLMKLVEVIVGMATSKSTEMRIVTLCQALGKEITRSEDYPGFVVNRILMPMINEAFDTLMEGVATAEDIDRGMKLGTNQPMGPLALADFIGLDTCHAILNVLHQGFGQPKYRPSPLLRKYVEAGFLGRKTKRGVFNYD